MESWVEQGRVLQDGLGTEVVDGTKTSIGVRVFGRSGAFYSCRAFFGALL